MSSYRRRKLLLSVRTCINWHSSIGAIAGGWTWCVSDAPEPHRVRGAHLRALRSGGQAAAAKGTVPVQPGRRPLPHARAAATSDQRRRGGRAERCTSAAGLTMTAPARVMPTSVHNHLDNEVIRSE